MASMIEPRSTAARTRPPGTFDPEPWRNELLSYLRRLGAGDEADDLVQETFLRSIRQPPAGEPRAWLYGIARNLFRDRLRLVRRDGRARESGTLVTPADPGDPAIDAEKQDLLAVASRIIDSLSPRQKTAVVLRLRQHLSYDEVGAVLGCSAATARQHVYLGLKAVRDAMFQGDPS